MKIPWKVPRAWRGERRRAEEEEEEEGASENWKDRGIRQPGGIRSKVKGVRRNEVCRVDVGDERERERVGKILGVTGSEGKGRQEEVRSRGG